MSPATIDRYPAPAGRRTRCVASSRRRSRPAAALVDHGTQGRGRARTNLDSSRATRSHCGPTLKGEFARTLNLTCVNTGWVFTPVGA